MTNKFTNEALEKKVKELEKKNIELKASQKKIERISLVLRTIRNVNQLIVREKDSNKLIQGIVDSLIENRGYFNAWIALFDPSGRFISYAKAGLGKAFLPVLERLKSGKLTDCGRKAFKDSGVILINAPISDCNDCPLSQHYAGRSAMTVRLEHNAKVYGLLSMSIPGSLVTDEKERALLAEIAGDVAFALHDMALEKERKQAEDALQEYTYKLNERVKELNCLFDISKLVEKRRVSLEEIIQGTVDLIPSGWQHPDITCARITLENQEFKTGNFKETPWKLASGIELQGEPVGALEVFSLADKPEMDEGPFLREERNLANAITERMGRIIERKRAEAALQKSEKRFRDLVESAPVGISIIQEGRIIYQNPEQEKL
ncbi:MAG: hypothetical protein JRJ85_06230, partial [Deltaproteobacteria bacterium]|nr:hypothetical protein [Deltaproteobacteria bacterium]